ncbi:hypothetical protein QAD02_023594 [Eretmocerus hayati]|uniref:Uncharacterized protein n=1 Tax=Eretmocerus hayati TaxID=131215 RepID=A0ACC2PWK7_9HYME|nr:hypothetical protein QAD02_023594 [Eretmocerus hayati]
MRHSTNPRFIKRYLFNTLIFLSFVVIMFLLVKRWKYHSELEFLQKLVDENSKMIDEMGSLTPIGRKSKDAWRIPDVPEARIFSAYFDPRPEVVLNEGSEATRDNGWALIRIIAIIDVSYEGSEQTCYYKFPAKTPIDETDIFMEARSIAVKIIAKQENHGEMKYSASFVLCRLMTTENGKLPIQVTFSSTAGKTPEELKKIDFVNVQYRRRNMSSDQSRFMGACIPSLHHNYDKYTSLVEFIEFYRMMGVNHFTFYKTSASENVSRILDYYEKLGLVTIIQWKLPPFYIFEQNLRYNGIFAALNDCLYRSTLVEGYEYIVNVDLDEFIVPRKHNNFHQLMTQLNPVSSHNENVVFVFRNMFFYLTHLDSPVPQIPQDLPKLLLHTKTTRLKKIHQAYERSKYICVGYEVVELGNHQVWFTKTVPWFIQYGK